MRFSWVGMLAFAFMTACLRLSYDARRVPAGPKRDAGQLDGSTAPGFDAGVADAGAQTDDASTRDASTPDSSIADASSDSAAGAGAKDAEIPDDDGGVPNDGAVQAPMDAAADAALSGTSPCEVSVTTNEYLGDPHYHGTLALQNTGAATWMTPTISFDLPGAAYVCNDENKLPGTAWALQSSAGHCTYTRMASECS